MDIRAIRLRNAMEEKGISQTELAKRVGISKGSLSSYLSGRYFPRQNMLHKLSLELNVSPAYLMGFDTPEQDKDDIDILKYDGIQPVTTQTIPLLGEISCGTPTHPLQEHETITTTNQTKADFCLKAKGDSMINARIHDGDLVFVHKQPTVQNGEIAVIIINDETTLKRVYYYPEQNRIILQAENPAYPPLIYTNEELTDIHILGKAIAFQSNLQ